MLGAASVTILVITWGGGGYLPSSVDYEKEEMLSPNQTDFLLPRHSHGTGTPRPSLEYCFYNGSEFRSLASAPSACVPLGVLTAYIRCAHLNTQVLRV